MVVAAVERVPAAPTRTGTYGHAIKRQHGFCAGNLGMAVLPAASGAELGTFLRATVAAQSHLLTDGFEGYQGRAAALADHLKHTPVIQDGGTNAPTLFPIIHTVFSTMKAWLIGTHQGVSAKHLPRYLREWTYRFHRRSKVDGRDGDLIRRAIECTTITYRQLIAGGIPDGSVRNRRLPPQLQPLR